MEIGKLEAMSESAVYTMREERISEAPWWRRDIWTLANAITAIKIPLAVLFPIVGTGWRSELAILFIAGISDILDGWIARKMGQSHGFGMILDPICDKLFLMTVVGTFLFDGRLGPGALLVVTLRDLYVLVASGFLFATGRWRECSFQARFFGKLTTFLQFALLALVVLEAPIWFMLGPVLVVSLLACLDYSRAPMRKAKMENRV